MSMSPLGVAQENGRLVDLLGGLGTSQILNGTDGGVSQAVLDLLSPSKADRDDQVQATDPQADPAAQAAIQAGKSDTGADVHVTGEHPAGSGSALDLSTILAQLNGAARADGGSGDSSATPLTGLGGLLSPDGGSSPLAGLLGGGSSSSPIGGLEGPLGPVTGLVTALGGTPAVDESTPGTPNVVSDLIQPILPATADGLTYTLSGLTGGGAPGSLISGLGETAQGVVSDLLGNGAQLGPAVQAVGDIANTVTEDFHFQLEFLADNLGIPYTVHGITNLGNTVGVSDIGGDNLLTNVLETPGALLNGAPLTDPLGTTVHDVSNVLGATGDLLQGVADDLVGTPGTVSGGHGPLGPIVTSLLGNPDLDAGQPYFHDGYLVDVGIGPNTEVPLLSQNILATPEQGPQPLINVQAVDIPAVIPPLLSADLLGATQPVPYSADHQVVNLDSLTEGLNLGGGALGFAEPIGSVNVFSYPDAPHQGATVDVIDAPSNVVQLADVGALTDQLIDIRSLGGLGQDSLVGSLNQPAAEGLAGGGASPIAAITDGLLDGALLGDVTAIDQQAQHHANHGGGLASSLL